MKESLTIETKLGDVEVSPRFTEDGRIYAFCKIHNNKPWTVNRVDVHGSVYMEMFNAKEGFQPQDGEKYDYGFDVKARKAAYLHRVDSYEDASPAAKVKVVKELQKALNTVMTKKDFREVVIANSEESQDFGVKSAERDVEEAEKKLKEAKAKLRKAKARKPDMFKKVGL